MEFDGDDYVDGAPLSILLVDDEPDILDMLELSVASLGYVVTSAASGEEALERAEQKAFDLAFVDLRMPGLDGIAVTRALKELDPAIDVVISSAYLSGKLRAACLESGASEFISKPFALTDLESLLRRAVERRRAGSGRPR